jgi:predicted ABC-type ATPase
MNIYIIAGPPGVGKSTVGYRFVPTDVAIIDQDLAAYHYRKDGFADYQHLATLKSNQQIKDFLFSQKDFALELNLGFQSHYNYLKSIASFNPENTVHLILFYTNTVEFCLLRAEIRHKKGGHLVKPEIVREMYEETMPLLKQNLNLFKTFRFIDVSANQITEVTPNNIPLWLNDNDIMKLIG